MPPLTSLPPQARTLGAVVGLTILGMIVGRMMLFRHPSRGEAARAPSITELTDTVSRAGPTESRAKAVVELARTADEAVIPLLIVTIEDDDPIVAGRALAAVQHRLGVRYPVDEWPVDRAARRRLAAMAREDLAALNGPGRDWWTTHTKPVTRP